MRILSLLFLLLSATISGAQVKLNTSLKDELDSMYKRHNMFISLATDKERERKADSLVKTLHLKNTNELIRYLYAIQKNYDSLNIIRIKSIIEQHGYPGKSLVGTPTNEVAFYILQRYLNLHTEEFSQYFPILKKAAETGELPYRLYAEALDKNLMLQEKEQVYGTQIKAIDYPAGTIRAIKTIVWPIKDPATVNQRRKSIGINETVEEMAKRVNVIYQVYTLDDIKKLQKK